MVKIVRIVVFAAETWTLDCCRAVKLTPFLQSDWARYKFENLETILLAAACEYVTAQFASECKWEVLTTRKK